MCTVLRAACKQPVKLTTLPEVPVFTFLPTTTLVKPRVHTGQRPLIRATLNISTTRHMHTVSSSSMYITRNNKPAALIVETCAKTSRDKKYKNKQAKEQ
jgi:hypothetical protein